MKWSKDKLEMVTEEGGTSESQGSGPFSSILTEIQHRAVDGPL